jgi:hypothetical protein
LVAGTYRNDRCAFGAYGIDDAPSQRASDIHRGCHERFAAPLSYGAVRHRRGARDERREAVMLGRGRKRDDVYGELGGRRDQDDDSGNAGDRIACGVIR